MSSTTATPESTASVKVSVARPPIEKLAYRITELSAALGLSRRQGVEGDIPNCRGRSGNLEYQTPP
jgi:hypothetical protein